MAAAHDWRPDAWPVPVPLLMIHFGAAHVSTARKEAAVIRLRIAILLAGDESEQTSEFEQISISCRPQQYTYMVPSIASRFQQCRLQPCIRIDEQDVTARSNISKFRWLAQSDQRCR
jgi:hypothetical protein